MDGLKCEFMKGKRKNIGKLILTVTHMNKVENLLLNHGSVNTKSNKILMQQD